MISTNMLESRINELCAELRRSGKYKPADYYEELLDRIIASSNEYDKEDAIQLIISSGKLSDMANFSFEEDRLLDLVYLEAKKLYSIGDKRLLMNWTPTEKEIQSLIALPAAKRYEYWIKKVADQQKVWSLWRDGWSLASDNEGREFVPVWPHPKYAELCATDQWTGYVPKVIDLEAWLERWILGIEKDNRWVAVFPTPSDRGIAVEPSKLGSDLREEMSRYE